MSSEKSLTPQIRFKGFTEAWEQRKLKDLFAYGGSGGTPSSNNRDYYNGNIPFLNISDLKERNIRFTEKQITTLGLHNSAAWIVPAGSISLAMYASVGKVGIICNDTATSQAFYNMVFQDILVRNFLYTRLEKADFCNEWEPYISTGTQRNLNAEKVRNFKINIPSKHEMNQIGSIFEILDSLITLHQRKLDALKKIKSALLEKMFPKDGSDIPEIRFAGFTEAWEQRKLGEVFCESTDRSDTLEILSVSVSNGIYPAIESDRIINPGASISNYKVVYPNDVVFNSMRMWQGAVDVSRYKGIVSPAYVVARPLLEVDARLFSRLLKQPSMLSKYKQISQGNSKDTLTLKYDKFALISIIMPKSIKEQSLISRQFDMLDDLITLHQRKLDALKKIKSALLEKMFV